MSHTTTSGCVAKAVRTPRSPSEATDTSYPQATWRNRASESAVSARSSITRTEIRLSTREPAAEGPGVSVVMGPIGLARPETARAQYDPESCASYVPGGGWEPPGPNTLLLKGFARGTVNGRQRLASGPG